MGDVEQFHLPPECATYTLHPCLVYAVGGIQHVQEGLAGIPGARRRTRPFPAAGAQASCRGIRHMCRTRAAAKRSRNLTGPEAGSVGCGQRLLTTQRATSSTSRFEILQKLGQGGFSKVYRVRDDVEGKERALKLFNSAAGY